MNRAVPLGAVDRVRRDRHARAVEHLVDALRRGVASPENSLLVLIHRAAAQGELPAFARAVENALR